MIREERFRKILKVLESQGFTTAESLSKTFYISLPTVYRDLREMEHLKLIVRSNGGAVCSPDERVTSPVDFRKSVNAREKEAIASEAAKLIPDHAVIFIDASTTAAHLVDHLSRERDLTVLTNGLLTAACLREAGIKTYCVGGSVIRNSLAVGGKIANHMVDQFEFDLVFFSAYGISENGVIIDPSESETSLRRHILKKQVTSVFLCDKSKFGKSSVFRVAPLDAIDYLITNAEPPANYPQVRQRTIVI